MGRCYRSNFATGYASPVSGKSDSGGAPRALRELDRRLVGWWPDRVGTLMFVQRGGSVLLIRKRRGHGAGKINGPGGKREPGETPLECALRETAEEVGIRPRDPRLAAVLRFLDTDDADWLGYVFVAGVHDGTPRTTAEAIPAWYPLHDLPFAEMWEDDRLWLPRVLAGETLRGAFLFERGRLRSYRVQACAEPAGRR